MPKRARIICYRFLRAILTNYLYIIDTYIYDKKEQLARHTHHDGGSVYRERDTRIDHQLDLPQVAEQVRKLHSSVYARRRYENKVKTDPALLGGRRRLIVC